MYANVEEMHRRIDAAEREGATSLDLSGLKLRELPDRIADLTNLRDLDLSENRLTGLPALPHLTGLDLSGNRLTEVPSVLARLPQLRHLHINRTGIAALPDWLGDLTGLEELNLGGNRLTGLPDWIGDLPALSQLILVSNPLKEPLTMLGRLTGLKHLELGGVALKALPGWLAGMTELASLGLGYNQISDIPEWLGDLGGLEFVDLSGNGISDLPVSLARLERLIGLQLENNHLVVLPEVISQLSTLRRLDLGSNGIFELPSWIGSLAELEMLGLSRNGLTELPDSISELARLEHIRLNGNRFAEIPGVIARLVALENLDLWANQIVAVPDWIGDLSGLEQLDLSDNSITELPDSLAHLGRLAWLDVGNNDLAALPAWIGDLARLEYLRLDANRLTALPDSIGELARLEELDIDNNGFTVMPRQIANLGSLKTLYISRNGLAEVPGWLGDLGGIQEIYLEENELTGLPDEIGNLAELKVLSLASNQLTAIPDGIGRLAKLEQLHLDGNRLKRLPDSIGGLARLDVLDLSDNEIADLPEWVGRLSGLSRLSLSGNRLTGLPSNLGDIRMLERLDASGNRLTSAPTWLIDLPELNSLALAGNPLLSPPPEIAASGHDSVLAFLRARREGASRQWASKLLVVGEGMVGKTSLVKALTGDPYDPTEPTTHGLRVTGLRLAHPEHDGVEMKLSVWDFGGQQIYHATHQFFLSDRSLFLLLWNPRLGWEQGKLRYWLDIIKARAPESPILLVATHGDANERPVDLPLDELREEYPRIVGSLTVDSETRSGIDEVTAEITRLAAGLPLMGTEWPTTWLNAANAVRALDDKHITPAQMWQIMTDQGVTDRSQQEYIAVALHQLGDILFYHDDEELDQTVVLQPEWVNDYISRVLDSERVEHRDGILTREDVNELWHDLDRGMRDHFLGMMDRYDLSYRVDGDGKADVSLVVERLPWNPPAYQEAWDELRGKQEIKVLYRLNTMPPGIPTWFIARSHRFTLGTHWRTGVVLQHPDGRHRALVRAYPHRNLVELVVRGPAPAAFFSILDDGLNRTLDRFPGLEIIREVACPCQNAAGGTCAGTYDYEDLQRRLSHDPPRETIECRKSWEELPVRQLLYGLAPSERDDRRAQLDRIERIVADTNGKLYEQAEYVQRSLLKLQRTVQGQQEVLCPSVFTLVPVDHRGPGRRAFELRLYCEEPGAWHRLPDDAGRYRVTMTEEWLRKIAPTLKYLVGALKHAAPLVGPALGIAEVALDDRQKSEIDGMKELVAQLPSGIGGDGPLRDTADTPRPASHAGSEADYRELAHVLTEVDPKQGWGGLIRTVTPEGLTLYLCRKHSEAYRRAARV